jgi:hypothetical protein
VLSASCMDQQWHAAVRARGEAEAREGLDLRGWCHRESADVSGEEGLRLHHREPCADAHAGAAAERHEGEAVTTDGALRSEAVQIEGRGIVP